MCMIAKSTTPRGQSRGRGTPSPLRRALGKGQGKPRSRSNSRESNRGKRQQSPRKPAVHPSWLKEWCIRCGATDHVFNLCPKKQADFICSGNGGCGKPGHKTEVCLQRLLKDNPSMAFPKTPTTQTQNTQHNSQTRVGRSETRQAPPPAAFPRAASASEQDVLYYAGDSNQFNGTQAAPQQMYSQEYTPYSPQPTPAQLKFIIHKGKKKCFIMLNLFF